MYFVALIKYRITRNIEFSEKAKRYKDKFSRHGFKDHLATEYKAAPGFMTKIVLFLGIYPSLIDFLNRLFVDKKDTFENDQEPPYVNRNWLLHGRCDRDIERYECIQLLNALSVFEFTIDTDKE